MELRHLTYFLTLAEELHFNRAAEKLYIAQPPLSRQIKDLEEELGVPLFNRTKKKVELTPYGIYLRDEASKIFHRLDLIRNHLKQLKKGVIGEVKIGYIGSAMLSYLPILLDKLKEKSPEIDIFLTEANTAGLLKALKSGIIDLGFIRAPLEAHDIIVKPVFKETFSLVLPMKGELSSRENWDLKNLATKPFIGFSSHCTQGIIKKVISICNRAGFYPNIIHQCSNYNSILRLVESNMGYSIVPSSIKCGYKLNICYIELDEYPERAELSLAINPENMTATSEKVVEIIFALTPCCIKQIESIPS